MKVSVAQAKNRLPELIKAAERGEAVTICRHGKPVADLVRTAPDAPRGRVFGRLSHLAIELDPDWWKPMSEEEAVRFLEGR